jgi:hypothetical protein
MMIGNQKLRDQLRDLPTGYLLDLLADAGAIDEPIIRDILGERGLSLDEIALMVRRRLDGRIPRGHSLWQGARIFTLACTLLVAIFNLISYHRLLHGTSSLKGLLLILCAIGVAFGFFLGYKLTTHLYQGAPHRLYCGFPLPVGSIDLRTGREELPPRPLLMLCMAVNATVGLMVVLFPLLLIHYLLD